jgi:hypothetical protein
MYKTMPECPVGQTYNRALRTCRDKKKPGRKAGTKKRRCPVGQTYNRTLRACRDFKKRGRAVATSPARLASPKKIKFTFKVNLRGSGSGYVDDNALLKWYRGFADEEEYPGIHIKPTKKTGVFEGSYNIDGMPPRMNQKAHIESLIDPDEDGNYPIVIDGEEYLVIGKLLTINGKPVSA